MLPAPVSAMAVSVVGPAGLMSACGFSVAVPDLPVVRFTQVTFSGSFCTSAGPGVPIAVNTYAVWPGAGPGVGIFAGPATEIAVANTFPPSFRHPLLIDGYMKSCVTGASAPKVGAAPASGPGAGAGSGPGTDTSGAGAGTASGAGASAASGAGAGRASG